MHLVSPRLLLGRPGTGVLLGRPQLSAAGTKDHALTRLPSRKPLGAPSGWNLWRYPA